MMNERKVISCQLPVASYLIVMVYFVFLPISAFAQEGGDCAQFKKEHEALLNDYNNVLSQIKALLPYKEKAKDLEDSFRQFDIVKEQLAKEKEEVLKQNEELKEKIMSLDQNVVKLGKESDDYKKSFEKATVENIIGEDTKKKIADLGKEKDAFYQKAGDLEARIKVMENASLKEQAQTEFYKRQLAEVKDKYESVKKQNRVLEKKLEDTPGKFAELARENKILIKRTSMMHYNLGVFYTQNKEFERAVSEFEKAVELNPEDSSSHFNLGYIYAEHLLNRQRAVMHFKQYLKLAKKDDKDVDWAKRYILTWQTWEGNVPIK